MLPSAKSVQVSLRLFAKARKEKMIDVDMIEKKITEDATKLLDWANSAGEFVADQAPIYVQELIKWKFFDASVNAVVISCLSLLLILIAIYLIRGCVRASKKDSDYYLILVPISICWFVVLIPTSMSIAHIKNAVKCKIAPRVVVVEELSKIIKK